LRTKPTLKKCNTRINTRRLRTEGIICFRLNKKKPSELATLILETSDLVVLDLALIAAAVYQL
jgi:hypothetical protein